MDCECNTSDRMNVEEPAAAVDIRAIAGCLSTTKLLPELTQTHLTEVSWRGASIEEVHRCMPPFELDHLPAVEPHAGHSVLFHVPIGDSAELPPLPLHAAPKWDSQHVRLPCSHDSKYPVKNADGSTSIESRWEMIERALLRPINNCGELEAAILAYNSKYEGNWKFEALHMLFEEELDESETRVFFEDLLPRIIRLALRLPQLITAPIPLLKQYRTHTVSLTQEQCACLLANAFLCTFPRRNTLKRKSEYSNFPDINFNRLYQHPDQAVLEKLKCIFHYFRRVCPTDRDASNVPSGCVSFMRRSCKPDELPDWTQCGAPLNRTPLHINAHGTIEDQGMGLLQVDFANKFLGGGVLGRGCVQEEIRFVICPELIVSKLLTECLRPSEALLMLGCERYSNYKGYASSFCWHGNHEDVTPRDSSRRRMTSIVAIDALKFKQADQQYRVDLMLRELNKAYVGFMHMLALPAPGVATGNWGCGAFGGNAQLKALLQLIVCCAVDRPLAYYTFGNEELRDELHAMYQLFKQQQTSVQQLWAIIRRFEHSGSQTLYQFIKSQLLRQTSPCTGCSQPKSAAVAKPVHSPVLFANTSSPDTSTGGGAPLELLSDEEENNTLLPATGFVVNTSSRKINIAKEQTTIADNGDGHVAAAAAGSESTVHCSVKGTRQLTLLEMLDSHYNRDGLSNGSKRQRQNEEAAESEIAVTD